MLIFLKSQRCWNHSRESTGVNWFLLTSGRSFTGNKMWTISLESRAIEPWLKQHHYVTLRSNINLFQERLSSSRRDRERHVVCIKEISRFAKCLRTRKRQRSWEEKTVDWSINFLVIFMSVSVNFFGRGFLLLSFAWRNLHATKSSEKLQV